MKRVNYLYSMERGCCDVVYADTIYVEELFFDKTELKQQIEQTHPERYVLNILSTENGYEPYIVEEVRYRKVR